MREETRPGWPNHAKGQLEPEPQDSAQGNYKKESRRSKYMYFEGSSVSEKGQSVQVGISTLLVSTEKSNCSSFYFLFWYCSSKPINTN